MKVKFVWYLLNLEKWVHVFNPTCFLHADAESGFREFYSLLIQPVATDSSSLSFNPFGFPPVLSQVLLMSKSSYSVSRKTEILLFHSGLQGY